MEGFGGEGGGLQEKLFVLGRKNECEMIGEYWYNTVHRVC